MKSKGLQPRLLPSKVLIENGKHIKEFSKQTSKKAKRIHLHQTSTARDAKGTAFKKMKKKRGEHRYKGEKMAMSKYLL